MPGHVEAINIRPTSQSPAVPVERARLLSGRGLEGDRYYAPAGAGSGEALTLIATEALEGLEADTGIRLSAADSRRQVLTRGIDLNALVDASSPSGACAAWASSCANRARISRPSPRMGCSAGSCIAEACAPTC
jgi:hypothetical protein